MKITAIGYHLGDRLDLKTLRHSLAFECIYADPTEVIYQTDENSYLQVFDYGSVVFLGIPKTAQTDIINSIRNILSLAKHELVSEEFGIEVNPESPYKVLFDKVIVKTLNLETAKVVMLNVAQSAALDYYIEQADRLLQETTKFCTELEEKGKFSLKGKHLLMYIGRTLNLKTRIMQNLYIFDSPNLTWNDEFLNRLNNDLIRELDIRTRHGSLQDSLGTVRENLQIFNSISQHSHSSNLEWIVIALIAVEIFNVFFEKF